MSFTDQQVLNEIQYTVIEPPDSGATWPSGMWTAAETVRYLNQRQDRFIFETHPYVTAANIAVTAGDNLYDLPAGFVKTVRVIWTPTSGTAVELTRGDDWEADHGIPTWTTVEDVPKIYIIEPTLEIKLAPIPDSNGTLRIYYIKTGTTFTGGGISATLQDEMIPSLKYGALADMFGKVGRAHDPIRAKYCADRFQLGIDVTNILLKGFTK